MQSFNINKQYVGIELSLISLINGLITITEHLIPWWLLWDQ